MMHDTDEYDKDEYDDDNYNGYGYDNNDNSYDDDDHLHHDNDDRDDDDRDDDDDYDDVDYDDDIEVPVAWVGEPEGTSVVARFSVTLCNIKKITIIKNMIGDIFRDKDDQRKVVEN